MVEGFNKGSLVCPVRASTLPVRILCCLPSAASGTGPRRPSVMWRGFAGRRPTRQRCIGVYLASSDWPVVLGIESLLSDLSVVHPPVFVIRCLFRLGYISSWTVFYNALSARLVW